MLLDAPLFICDDHCGRLARWLRFLGYDCRHEQDILDGRLLQVAADEGRIILTRDKHLAAQVLARRVILLASAEPVEQLQQVCVDVPLSVCPKRAGVRCTVCNEMTDPVTGDAIADRIPPYVGRTRTVFRECPICRRVYWHGTHMETMVERLRSAGILPAATPDADRG